MPAVNANATVLMIRGLRDHILPLPPLAASEVVCWHSDYIYREPGAGNQQSEAATNDLTVQGLVKPVQHRADSVSQNQDSLTAFSLHKPIALCDLNFCFEFTLGAQGDREVVLVRGGFLLPAITFGNVRRNRNSGAPYLPSKVKLLSWHLSRFGDDKIDEVH